MLLLLALAMVLAACEKVKREVPTSMVQINLTGHAMWNTYGVSGIGDYRIFNRAKKLPANFPYNMNTYTGFGGVLLIVGLDAASGNYEPLAFDAACPVENSPEVSVSIDASNFDAVCPQCKSRFNVLTGSGGPLSGMAFTNRYRLTPYKAHPSQMGGYTITTY